MLSLYLYFLNMNIGDIVSKYDWDDSGNKRLIVELREREAI